MEHQKWPLVRIIVEQGTIVHIVRIIDNQVYEIFLCRDTLLILRFMKLPGEGRKHEVSVNYYLFSGIK